MQQYTDNKIPKWKVQPEHNTHTMWRGETGGERTMEEELWWGMFRLSADKWRRVKRAVAEK